MRSESGKYVLSMVYGRAVEHILLAPTLDGDLFINDALLRQTDVVRAIEGCHHAAQAVLPCPLTAGLRSDSTDSPLATASRDGARIVPTASPEYRNRTQLSAQATPTELSPPGARSGLAAGANTLPHQLSSTSLSAAPVGEIEVKRLSESQYEISL